MVSICTYQIFPFHATPRRNLKTRQLSLVLYLCLKKTRAEENHDLYKTRSGYLDCSQALYFLAFFYLIVERADRIARELDASARLDLVGLGLGFEFASLASSFFRVRKLNREATISVFRFHLKNVFRHPHKPKAGVLKFHLV